MGSEFYIEIVPIGMLKIEVMSVVDDDCNMGLRLEISCKIDVDKC